jgi:hypothetical protein
LASHAHFINGIRKMNQTESLHSLAISSSQGHSAADANRSLVKQREKKPDWINREAQTIVVYSKDVIQVY